MESSESDQREKIYDANSLKYLMENQRNATESHKNMSLDRVVEEFVVEMTNDFLHSLITTASELSGHRKSDQIEAQDLNFVLENIWKMHGYRSEEGRMGQRRNLTDVHPLHDARMGNIKKLQQPPEKKKGTKKL